MPTFAIGDDDFLLDGEPFRILSGAIHYFRVHPDLWADRIRKARQMGLNTIETYVAWNAHSPSEGEFRASGPLDLARFLDLIAAEGMFAIVRPGPYICAEWDNGGLPAWLFRKGGVGIRRNEPTYMAAVEGYFEHLAPILVPRQIQSGGPIILVQIENEYGAYGTDKDYLAALVQLNRNIGLTVPFTTVDQPVDDMLENGSVPGLHKTASFGSRAIQRLETLRRHQPTGPLMCSEFWEGWFDNWGAYHHTTSAAQAAKELEDLLERGSSVNIYMFHGGTNFGFSNGANDKGIYEPIVTSYDYDALLDEAGNPTAKYWAFREVLGKFAPLGPDEPGPAEPSPELTAPIRQVIPLWDALEGLGAWSGHREAPTFDAVGQFHGFLLYRTQLDVHGASVLEMEEVRDRAQLFLNGNAIGIVSRDLGERAAALPKDANGTLDILVEDMGRVDYGPRLGEHKGLIGAISVNSVPVPYWDVLPLELDQVDRVAGALRRAPMWSNGTTIAGPSFARAEFDLAAMVDLHLDTEGWGKGVVWVNGFCLGRYWSRGPQKTLYVPAPILRLEGNEIIVFELQVATRATVSFVSSPDLGAVDH